MKDKIEFVSTAVTDIGDPFVLLHGGKYYMYATSAPDGFKVWSADNIDGEWKDEGYCYKATEECFGFRNFWAPEVRLRFDGKLVMHYTARWKEKDSLRIGVAVSDSPLGPFKDADTGKPMFDFGWAAIDAHCFTDDDGKSYLYYVRDVSENIRDGIRYSDIYVSELNKDLTQIITEPKIALEPSQDWEMRQSKDWRWNEGPFVHKHDGKYYLMYSANCFDCKFYGVGYAVANSPLGPFVKAEENPILEYDERMSGPGHNALFTDKAGNLINAFHIHTFADKPSGNRRACFCRVRIKHNKLEFY